MVTNKGSYSFPSELNPDGKKVVAIEVRRQNAAGSAKDINKATLASDGVLANSFLKLAVKGSKEMNKGLPLDYLVTNPAAYAEPRALLIEPIRLNDCTLTLDTAAAGFVAGNAIEFTIWYDCTC